MTRQQQALKPHTIAKGVRLHACGFTLKKQVPSQLWSMAGAEGPGPNPKRDLTALNDAGQDKQKQIPNGGSKKG